MASTINANNNRTIRAMPKDKGAQAWVPLLTTAGMVVDVTRRALVADVIAHLMDAHLEASTLASFAAVSHGIRAVTDSVTGAGSPFFVEAKGASVGEVYLYDGAAKQVALLEWMPAGHIASVRVEAKGGLFVTLAKDADAARFYAFCALHGSNRGPVGYVASMGASTPVGIVATLADAPDAVTDAAIKKAADAAKADAALANKLSKRQAKREAKAAKQASA